jgi:hypothetical protein
MRLSVTFLLKCRAYKKIMSARRASSLEDWMVFVFYSVSLILQLFSDIVSTAELV